MRLRKEKLFESSGKPANTLLLLNAGYGPIWSDKIREAKKAGGMAQKYAIHAAWVAFFGFGRFVQFFSLKVPTAKYQNLSENIEDQEEYFSHW